VFVGRELPATSRLDQGRDGCLSASSAKAALLSAPSGEVP
jgi:hypothetical protein